MKREEWLKVRKQGIGGSEAAAACGLSKWQTPFELYQRKIGEGPPEDLTTPAQHWGTLKEPIVRQEYSNQTGNEVIVPNVTLVHPDPGREFAIANVDGVVMDGNIIYEGKTAAIDYGWGEPWTNQVPVEYELQVQHYMGVTGATSAHIAVLIGSSDFRIYEVEADAETQSLMFATESEFWAMVQDRKPPPPITVADARTRWPKSRANAIMASEFSQEIAERLYVAKAIKKQAEEICDELQLILQKQMGDCDTLISQEQELATWRTPKDSSRFDLKAFRDAHPELAEDFTVTSPGSRRFLLKLKKDQINDINNQSELTNAIKGLLAYSPPE